MTPFLAQFERVERPAFGIDRGLLRILVFGLGAVGRGLTRPGRQDAPTDRDRTPGRVADREEHTGPKEVLHAAAPVDEPETGVGQHVLGQLECRGHGVPVVRRPTQAELPDDLAVVAAGAEIVTGGAGVG